MAFHPVFTCIATGSEDASVKVWMLRRAVLFVRHLYMCRVAWGVGVGVTIPRHPRSSRAVDAVFPPPPLFFAFLLLVVCLVRSGTTSQAPLNRLCGATQTPCSVSHSMAVETCWVSVEVLSG